MTDLNQKATDRPPLSSRGEARTRILEWFIDNPSERFTRRGYSNQNNIPPTTVLDNLRWLVKEGLLSKEVQGSWSITQKGRDYVRNCRSGGRHAAYRAASKKSNLSQHATRFELHVHDRAFFHYQDLGKLGTMDKPVQMQGWEYHKCLIDGHEVRVFPNKVVLYVQEVFDVNVEETFLQAVNIAIDICQRLEKIGLFVDGLLLEHAHWERVKSILADVLIRHLGKYWYQLKDGKKFWLDFSGDQLNDETDSLKLRARMDAFVEDLPHSKAVFSDVDKIHTDVEGLKQVAHMMLQHDLNIVRMQQRSQPMPKDQTGLENYIG